MNRLPGFALDQKLMSAFMYTSEEPVPAMSCAVQSARKEPKVAMLVTTLCLLICIYRPHAECYIMQGRWWRVAGGQMEKVRCGGVGLYGGGGGGGEDRVVFAK